MDTQAIGRRLRALRMSRGRSLRDLAEALGVSHATIARWETGSTITAGHVLKAARVLDCSPGWLLDGSEPAPTVTVEAG